MNLAIPKKQAAFYGVILAAILFIVFLTLQSGAHRKISDMIQGIEFSSPNVKGDQLVKNERKSDEDLYKFINGSITVKRQMNQFNKELASLSQSELQALLTHTFLEPTADCSSNNIFRPFKVHALCMLGRFKPLQPCYAFSFSTHSTWEFESELASSIGCHVLAFDPSMKLPSHMRSERLLLLREGLRAAATSAAGLPSPPERSFLDFLQRFKADKVIIDVLKMDLGPHDWPALQTALNDGSLKQVKQLILIVRNGRDRVVTEDQLRLRIAILRGLQEAGFRRWYPRKLQQSQLDGVSLSYVNINCLVYKWFSARNPPESRIALPLDATLLSKSFEIQEAFTTKSPSTVERQAVTSIQEVARISTSRASVKKNVLLAKGPQFEQLVTIRRANLSAMSPAELDRMYFNLVEQQHLICPQSRRIGDADDGGWDVCFSGPFDIIKSSPCVAFSFGINNVWRYDDELADVYHCRVYMFDPSMTTVNDHQRRNTSWFYRIGLSSNNTVQSNGWKMRTLCRLFDELGYSNGTIDILKIDVDYWEWVVFEQALKEGCLSRVKQFMFETHTTGLFRKQSDYARFIRILNGIFGLGFLQWKWHKNPYSVFHASDSGLTRACCYEHYMVNTNYIKPFDL